MLKAFKNQWLAAVFSVGFAVSPWAVADTLYKCVGPGGSVAYSNKKAGFTGCKAIGSYEPAKPAAGSAGAKREVDYRENPATNATPAPEGSGTAKTMTGPETSKPAPKVLRGAVYRIERQNGVTEYTNIRPRKGGYALLFTYISTCVACDLHSTIDFAHTKLNLDAYKDVVAQAAADNGLDVALLRAVIHAESAFNPMALSSKGAQGLMQLMPGTADEVGVTDAFDAEQNIRGGARYLARMLKDFNGDERMATAAYNAGPGAVQKYAGVPPYAETQVYVERVATLAERYRKAL